MFNVKKKKRFLSWSVILSLIFVILFVFCHFLYEFDWSFECVLLDILVGHLGEMHGRWPVARLPVILLFLALCVCA